MPPLHRQNKLLKSIVIFLVSLFLIINIIFLFNQRILIWDEAVYLSMGKYLFSQGNIGLWEIMRPIIMPIIFGFGWFIGLNQILFAKLIEIGFSLGILIMIYLICKKCFSRVHGFLSIILMLITPTFVFYTGYFLTEIPSTFFGLLAVYLFIDKKYVLAGIFSSLAFMTRFPQGIILISLAILILLNNDSKTITNNSNISSLINYLFIRKKHQNSTKINVFSYKLFNLLKLGGGFVLVIFPYLLFNYSFYKEYTSAFNAILRPFLFAAYEESNPFQIVSFNLLDNLKYYFSYLLETNPLILIMCIIGLWVLFKKKYYLLKDKQAVLLTLVIILSYYVKIFNKQQRFSLAFLPYLIIVSSIGIIFLLKKFAEKKVRYPIIIAIFLLCLVSIHLDINIIKDRWKSSSEDYSEYYLFFKERNINGSIFTSDPIPSAYVDKKFIPYYLAYDKKHFDKLIPNNEWEQNEDIGAIIFTTNALPCKENDQECLVKRDNIIFELSKNKVLFNKSFFGHTHLIFTT